MASQPTAEFLDRANASVAVSDAKIHPAGGDSPGPAPGGVGPTLAVPAGYEPATPANLAGGNALGDAGGRVGPTPAVPAGYDQVARWHMQRYGTTREQLAMAACLMSLAGSRHPDALSRRCGGVRWGSGLEPKSHILKRKRF